MNWEKTRNPRIDKSGEYTIETTSGVGDREYYGLFRSGASVGHFTERHRAERMAETLEVEGKYKLD